MTHKRNIYGPGMSYGVFAGRDGSKGLGMSSLKPEDAVPDYSRLPESEMKVLNDWHGFFTYVFHTSKSSWGYTSFMSMPTGNGIISSDESPITLWRTSQTYSRSLVYHHVACGPRDYLVYLFRMQMELVHGLVAVLADSNADSILLQIDTVHCDVKLDVPSVSNLT